MAPHLLKVNHIPVNLVRDLLSHSHEFVLLFLQNVLLIDDGLLRLEDVRLSLFRAKE